MAEIKPKTPAEIRIMRKSCEIVKNMMKELEAMIRPGITTKTLDEFAYKYITGHSAKPSFKGYGPKNNRFPASICASVNNQLIHGIPNKTPLKEGDILSVDVGAYYQGYHSDMARTFAVGTIAPEAMRLIEITRASFFAGLKEARAGARLGDISAAIQETIESAGYSVVREFAGHGVGAELHEPPQISNYGKRGTGPVLPAGATLAIEPMVNMGSRHIVMEDDGWTIVTEDGSLCAHYENTALVTETGGEALTSYEE